MIEFKIHVDNNNVDISRSGSLLLLFILILLLLFGYVIGRKDGINEEKYNSLHKSFDSEKDSDK